MASTVKRLVAPSPLMRRPVVASPAMKRPAEAKTQGKRLVAATDAVARALSVKKVKREAVADAGKTGQPKASSKFNFYCVCFKHL